MITQQTANVFLLLGFIFIICPFLIACFYKLYRWGLIPRIFNKGGKR